MLLGVDPDQAIAAAQPGRGDEGDEEVLELGPDEWQAWEVFRACMSQWRITGGYDRPRYEGLDYSALEAVMRLLDVEPGDRREVFWMVQVMEGEARGLLNDRS